VAARGRLMQALPAGGVMVSIHASAQEIAASLAGMTGVDLAAVNGPAAVVISGDDGPVMAVAQQWRQRGRSVTQLRVSHAFHSVRMEPMLAEFADVLDTVTFQRPRIPVLSNVTGLPFTEDMLTGGYWVRQVRETVRFADAIGWLHDQGVTVFVEAGPDAVLAAMTQDCLPEEAVTVTALQRRDQSAEHTLLAGLARLFVTGTSLDWTRVIPPTTHRVDLPTYAFQRQRYWLETGPSTTGAETVLDGAEAQFWDAVEREDLAGVIAVLRLNLADGVNISATAKNLDQAADDEIFDFIDNELGAS
jgi:acyl transferase domain-containing protein